MLLAFQSEQYLSLLAAQCLIQCPQKTTGIFPFEFNVHLIRSLLTVLPNFTFHEHHSTVSSIFRALFHLLHCAD